MKRDNKPKHISKELYDLLSDIKELAIEHVTVSLKSLINSFTQIGYSTYLESIRPNHFRLEILEPVENSENCNFICGINIKCCDGHEATINACIWSNIKEFEYVIHDNKIVYPKR